MDLHICMYALWRVSTLYSSAKKKRKIIRKDFSHASHTKSIVLFSCYFYFLRIFAYFSSVQPSSAGSRCYLAIIYIYTYRRKIPAIYVRMYFCVCAFFFVFIYFFFINNINVGFSKRNVLICCWLTHSEISFVASHNLDSLCLFALVSSSKAHMCYTYKTLPGHYNEMLGL